MKNLLASTLGVVLLGCPAEPPPAVETEPEDAWFDDEADVAVPPGGMEAAAADGVAEAQAEAEAEAEREAATVREVAVAHVGPDVAVRVPPEPEPEPERIPPASAGSARARADSSAAERSGAPAPPETPAARGAAEEPTPAALPGPPPASPAGAKVEPKPAPLERLPGSYRFVGGATQRAGIAGAVEDVVAQMSVISRGIARRRLLEGAEPPSSLRIRVDADRIAVAFPHRTYTGTLGAAAVRVQGKSGERLRFKVRSRRDQLMLEFRGDRGGKRYVMRRGAGDRLHVRVTIFSPSLPASIVYQLTYRAT